MVSSTGEHLQAGGLGCSCWGKEAQAAGYHSWVPWIPTRFLPVNKSTTIERNTARSILVLFCTSS